LFRGDLWLGGFSRHVRIIVGGAVARSKDKTESRQGKEHWFHGGIPDGREFDE
jgi:hypothetical protein